MPFTPLHLGPGLAIKALAGRHFSLLSYALAQVAMDIEPLIGLLRNAEVLHGASHTYAAALVIGAIVALVSGPIRRLLLPLWNRELAFHRPAWFSAPPSLGAIPVLAGAFVGTFSHVLLDSLMHAEMSPLAPWAGGNRLLGVLSHEALHQLCMLSGLLGFTIWVALAWRRRTVAWRHRSAGRSTSSGNPRRPGPSRPTTLTPLRTRPLSGVCRSPPRAHRRNAGGADRSAAGRARLQRRTVHGSRVPGDRALRRLRPPPPGVVAHAIPPDLLRTIRVGSAGFRRRCCCG